MQNLDPITDIATYLRRHATELGSASSRLIPHCMEPVKLSRRSCHRCCAARIRRLETNVTKPFLVPKSTAACAIGTCVAVDGGVGTLAKSARVIVPVHYLTDLCCNSFPQPPSGTRPFGPPWTDCAIWSDI
jgi:hypothetical protein